MRLDLARARGPDRRIIGLADKKIVLEQRPERRHRHHDRGRGRAIRGSGPRRSASISSCEILEHVGAIVAAWDAEGVFLDKVEDRHRPLVIDIGRAARDRRFVQNYLGEAIAALGRLCGSWPVAFETQGDGARMGVEPFGMAKRHRRRPQRCSARASHLSSDVRFMKSRTPRPDEKRAERAVGST